MIDVLTTEGYFGIWEGIAPSSVYDYELGAEFDDKGFVRVIENRTSFETGATEVFLGQGVYTTTDGTLDSFTAWEDNGSRFHTYLATTTSDGVLTLGGMFDVVYPMKKLSGS